MSVSNKWQYITQLVNLLAGDVRTSEGEADKSIIITLIRGVVVTQRGMFFLVLTPLRLMGKCHVQPVLRMTFKDYAHLFALDAGNY